MSKAQNLLVFAMGATIGSLATYFITKNYFERRNQEDVESVKSSLKEYYEGKYKEEIEEEYKDQNVKEIAAEIIQQAGYAPTKNVKTVEETEEDDDSITIISPEEFGDYPDFKLVSLTYYADYVLADEKGNKVDVDSTVGEEALGSFGEYEDDSVHVRNMKLRTDYEILLDPRCFSEVHKRRS